MYHPRLDPDFAALGHGVARVDDEVHDHLVELPAVDADRQEPGIMVERKLDLFAHQPVQQVHQVRHRVAQVHDLELQLLLARKRQELAHQRRGAVGVLADLHKVAIFRIALVMAQQQQVAMAGDGRQQVVEIMRHPAGKFAHRLHLLALHELLFEAFEFGRVVQNGQKRRPRRVGDPAERDLQETLITAPPGADHLRPCRDTLRHGVGDPVPDRAAQPFDQRGEMAAFMRADPQERLRLPVGGQHLAIGARYAATPPAAISNARAATEAAGGSARPGTA
jgi:hypothetical protein